MKALILAAGYGTRLYPLTKDKPKPLLTVGPKPIINHIIDKILKIEAIDGIYIVTNQKFSSHFQKWADAIKLPVEVKIINDGTLSNDDRLGAIGDMDLVIKSQNVKDDLLVIGGDNLLEASLAEFIDFAKSKPAASCLGLYDLGNKELASQYGVVSIDKDERVMDFQEKPQQPASTLIAMCIYFYPREKLFLFDEYMAGPDSKDAPGNYIKWLYKRDVVYGHVLNGIWYDIGDLESYQKANDEFTEGGFKHA